MVSTAKSALTPENSDIHYGEVREDPTLELKVIESLAEELGRPLRVAVVASAGCTALSLLGSDAVETVDAIDANFAQVALTELRQAAMIHLNTDEQIAFLGYSPSSARVEMYQRVRHELSEKSAAFFDAREDLIEEGVARAGRLDQLFRELDEQLKDDGLDLQKPGKAVGTTAWREAFKTTFERGRIESLFGTQAFAYSRDKDFHEHLSSSFANALRRYTLDDNDFLARVFAPDTAAPALYLEDALQSRARDLGVRRMSVHHGPLLGRLTELSAERPYDFVQCSDITDWLPVPERHALLGGIKRSLSVGGALLARRLNGDGMLGAIVREHLDVDAALSSELLSADRSFLYREVVVGYRRDG